MSFRVRGLSPAPFRHLFGMPEAQLNALGIERHQADVCPGYPDRIELRDARPGETLLLLNYTHQPAATPYRSSHAIFVLENAGDAYDRTDEIPDSLLGRPLSLRGFGADGRMIDADLAAGSEIAHTIRTLFECEDIDYLHAHFAKRGCFAARIERA